MHETVVQARLIQKGISGVFSGMLEWLRPTLFRAVLIEHFFQCFLFFPRKTENIAKVWKFDRGQNIWKASRSNIWRKNLENMEIQKLAQKKNWKFRQKVLR